MKEKEEEGGRVDERKSAPRAPPSSRAEVAPWELKGSICREELAGEGGYRKKDWNGMWKPEGRRPDRAHRMRRVAYEDDSPVVPFPRAGRG